jgi:hypothetical protein
MGRVLLVLALLLVVASSASAAEWPANRQFLIVEPPVPDDYGPPPSGVAEGPDGALLVLMYWPLTHVSKDGSVEAWDRSRLVRIAPDGARAFVPPFGDVKPGHHVPRVDIEDDFLPLPDGSILFSHGSRIDVRHPDGSIAHVAGNGRFGFSGDGGPAAAAELGSADGLARLADGSILFSDYANGRVRRISPDGMIGTVAGNGEFGFSGDGGPATAATLRGPSDLLATDGGGFLIADTYNDRIRRVGADGVISTLTAAVSWPRKLARMPDGTLLVAEQQRIRALAADGTLSTVFSLPQGPAGRVGDFAGRHGDIIEAVGTTREGGILVIVSGPWLRAYYLAPPHTRRTLMGARDARVTQRGVKLTVDVTRPGDLRLEVRRRGRVIASVTRAIRAGRRTIALDHRFAPAYHDVLVTFRRPHGGTLRDHVRLFTSRTLPARLVVPADREGATRCRRLDGRRIDCEAHDVEEEQGGETCLNTTAYRLFATGVLYERPYGATCHRKPIAFDRRPAWTAPWRPLSAFR